MPACNKLPVAAIAIASVVAAAFVAGCKKSGDTGGVQSHSQSPPESHAYLTGTVTCNDAPVTCGYVLVSNLREDSLQAQPPKKVGFDWGEISEGGRYKVVAAPVGEVSVMVITDPDEFAILVNRIKGLNERAEGTGSGPNRIARQRPGEPQLPKENSKISHTVTSSTDFSEKPDPKARGGSGGEAVTGPRGGGNPKGRKAGEGSSKFAGIGENGGPNRPVEYSVEKTKTILAGLPGETRERLEAINKKYGVLSGAMRETTRDTAAEHKPQELDLKLTVD